MWNPHSKKIQIVIKIPLKNYNNDYELDFLISSFRDITERKINPEIPRFDVRKLVIFSRASLPR